MYSFIVGIPSVMRRLLQTNYDFLDVALSILHTFYCWSNLLYCTILYAAVIVLLALVTTSGKFARTVSIKKGLYYRHERYLARYTSVITEYDSIGQFTIPLHVLYLNSYDIVI